MPPVIKAENLSKKYKLRTANSQTGTLRDALAAAFKNPWRKFARSGGSAMDDFWALSEVGFAVEPGDTLGIIGSNGAGKSTLLKILSRITRPSTGEIRMRGRVGSLLEVGTGFHQELTGRENIFLNGAILGMRRGEIEKKFDEIVAFAEVEKFLETPVKFYSSGMYMRLAFAVAAHLEPEILIVDEVLAVGDAAFQKKCLGKMNEVAAGGRTILFVSHNAAALHRLCKSALYLESGRMKNFGAMKTVLAEYQADISVSNASNAADRQSFETVKDGDVRFLDWRLVDSSTEQPHSIFSREAACFEFMLASKRRPTNVHFKLTIQDSQERNVVIAHNLLGGERETELRPGAYKVRFRLNLPLKAGTYKLWAEVYTNEDARILDLWNAQPPLTILPVLEHDLPDDFQGIVNVPITFELQNLNS
jgi:lipopolysaccharide transport system ATP-binding protein